jgi:hypothetical protein
MVASVRLAFRDERSIDSARLPRAYQEGGDPHSPAYLAQSVT